MPETTSVRAGLYSLDDVRDNCGFGLIAHIKGKASHELLQTAVRSLTCMTHRGAVSADGKTGDGCGLLMQKPEGFFRKLARDELGVELAKTWAVGMVFLNPDANLAKQDRKSVV